MCRALGWNAAIRRATFRYGNSAIRISGYDGAGMVRNELGVIMPTSNVAEPCQ